MKTIIIYNSQTGFTKRYGDWIAESIGCQSVSLNDAQKMNLSEFDQIVFGSWAHAGSFLKIQWFKSLMVKFPQKRFAFFGVGASPLENNREIPVVMEKNFPIVDSKKCFRCYCPGGISYAKMKWLDRKLMQLLSKMLMNKKDATEDDKIKAKMISQDYDISDKKYIKELTDWLASC